MVPYLARVLAVGPLVHVWNREDTLEHVVAQLSRRHTRPNTVYFFKNVGKMAELEKKNDEKMSILAENRKRTKQKLFVKKKNSQFCLASILLGTWNIRYILVDRFLWCPLSKVK